MATNDTCSAEDITLKRNAIYDINRTIRKSFTSFGFDGYEVGQDGTITLVSRDKFDKRTPVVSGDVHHIFAWLEGYLHALRMVESKINVTIATE